MAEGETQSTAPTASATPGINPTSASNWRETRENVLVIGSRASDGRGQVYAGIVIIKVLVLIQTNLSQLRLPNLPVVPPLLILQTILLWLRSPHHPVPTS